MRMPFNACTPSKKANHYFYVDNAYILYAALIGRFFKRNIQEGGMLVDMTQVYVCRHLFPSPPLSPSVPL